MKRMLLVFAHPDDESFSCGLTIPKYIKDGWTISLLTATAGEEGSTGPYGDVSKEELAKIRKTELTDASKELGITDVTILQYHDGALKDQHSGELEDILYKKMVTFAPDIVVTYDTTGISNHPDHIKICFSTTFAFQKYAGEIIQTRQFIEDIEKRNPDVKKRHFVHHHSFALKEERFAEVVESDAQPKLYFACVPHTSVAYLQKKGVFPEESFGKPLVGVADKAVTTVIDGNEEKLIKLKALAKYKSQSEDVDRFYEDESNPLIAREFFILRMHGITEIYMGKNDAVSTQL